MVNRSDRSKPATTGKQDAAGAYHHGSLRQALLEAADRILKRDGIQGLTLRAAAREVGVSHAAPKNHFGTVRGLLSDLAALGFERLAAEMIASVEGGNSGTARMNLIGRGYIVFAKANPDLFLLMFRGDSLDYDRPGLREAMQSSFGILSGSIGARRQEGLGDELTMDQAANITAAWSLVHGFAMLSLDGRLDGLLARLPKGTSDMDLLAVIFNDR